MSVGATLITLSDRMYDSSPDFTKIVNLNKQKLIKVLVEKSQRNKKGGDVREPKLETKIANRPIKPSSGTQFPQHKVWKKKGIKPIK